MVKKLVDKTIEKWVDKYGDKEIEKAKAWVQMPDGKTYLNMDRLEHRVHKKVSRFSAAVVTVAAVAIVKILNAD